MLLSFENYDLATSKSTSRNCQVKKKHVCVSSVHLSSVSKHLFHKNLTLNIFKFYILNGVLQNRKLSRETMRVN